MSSCGTPEHSENPDTLSEDYPTEDDGDYDEDEEFHMAGDSEMFDGAYDEQAEDATASNDKGYVILAGKDIIEEQNQEVNRIMETCALKNPTWARILLRNYKWNVERLLNEVFEKGAEEVFKSLGIDSKEAMASQIDEEVTCQICFDDVAPQDAYAPSCQHVFCNDCWTGYISVKVKDGEAKFLKCMAPKCDQKLDDAVVVSFVDDDTKEKYTRALVESYVDDNENIKWCPSVPHCGFCIRVTAVGKCCDVQCKCGHSSCFGCAEQCHSPSNCAMFKEWQKKCKDDSETSNWLKANTKDCPSCNNAIEKDGGCNFVLCTKCQREFCWFCMFLCKKGESHTAHDCNKYQKGAGEAGVTEARATLQRYLHYFERFNGHNESTKLELNQRGRLFHVVGGVIESNLMTPSALHWVIEGVEKLVQCRHVLRNSYVMAFYTFDNATTATCPIKLTDANRKRLQVLFEDHQSELENTTERLSASLLKNPKVLTTEPKEAIEQIQQYTILAERRLRAVYDVVHKDILLGDCGLIPAFHQARPSPYHINIPPTEKTQLAMLEATKDMERRILAMQVTANEAPSMMEANCAGEQSKPDLPLTAGQKEALRDDEDELLQQALAESLKGAK